MRLSRDLLGTPLKPGTMRWTARDCALYALGIGAGQADPLRELEFTTGRGQVVYPTFGVVPGGVVGVGHLLELLGDAVDASTVLHGEQTCEQLEPLPTQADVVITGRISAIWDKGSSTVIETTTDTSDGDSGIAYCRTTASLFFRGVGGWGGERGPAGAARGAPERAPDRVLAVGTRPDQALLYRLSGDTNPLHVDPDAAARAGFERPILHGLCVYGVVGRVLLSEYAAADPRRFGSLKGRFSRPTWPGDTLTIESWHEPDGVLFQVRNQRGDTVMTNGSFTVRPYGGTDA